MHAIDAIRAALSFGDMGLRYIEDMRDAPLTRMSSQGNHPLWVLGHLAVVEGRLRQIILGEANPLERWKPLFDWGSEPRANAAEYPSFDEVLAAYRELRAKNLALLEEVGEAGLDRPTKAPPAGVQHDRTGVSHDRTAPDHAHGSGLGHAPCCGPRSVLRPHRRASPVVTDLAPGHFPDHNTPRRPICGRSHWFHRNIAMAQDVTQTTTAPPPRKRSILKIALCSILGLVAIFLVVVALQPADFRVERTGLIDAPAAIVFDEVNDFHRWQAWSPWAKLDPKAKNDFSGQAKGKGAKFSWSGNAQVGEGSMTILESQPNELVKIELHFERPFRDTSTAQFAFKPQDGKIAVTWSMFGHKNFIAKGMCMFMNMDKMLGGEFEKGLVQMKAAAEARAAGDRAEAIADEEETKASNGSDGASGS
jgi:hypothetical protein